MPSTAVRCSVRMSLVSLVVVLAGLVAADPAQAHSSLVSSTPSDGQALTQPLDRVALTFSEPPLTGLDAGLRIEVRDASGQDVSTGDVTVDGDTMAKSVTATDGAYSVLWRYVSPDGHPISGELAFDVDAPVRPTATPEPTDPAASTEETVAEETVTEETASAIAVPPVADGGSSTVPVLLAGGAGVVLIAAVLIAVARRRRVPADD